MLLFALHNNSFNLLAIAVFFIVAGGRPSILLLQTGDEIHIAIATAAIPFYRLFGGYAFHVAPTWGEKRITPAGPTCCGRLCDSNSIKCVALA